MITEDKLERAFNLLLDGVLTFEEDRSWISCKNLKCWECPLELEAGNENSLKCLPEFKKYLEENYEELMV